MYIYLGYSLTITITGTPAFSTGFVQVTDAGMIYIPNSTTFSGSATGPRFNVNLYGILHCGGSSVSFLPGNAAGVMASGGVYFGSGSAASAQSSPSNPTGTSNTSGVMMGLAGSITPAKSGNLLIVISGDITNSTAADGGKVQIRYGTGTAPSNGAALTGTAVGGLVRKTNPASGAATYDPFSVQAIVSGLVIGTAIWLDVSLAAITGGTATIANVSLSALEL